MGQKLTAVRVQQIFLDCLLNDGEDTGNIIIAEGITCTVGFHPDRLEKHKQEVIEMLDELPDEFKEGAGGGASFLHACFDRDGKQWSDLNQPVEQLFQLGMAVGKARLLSPRSRWKVLPGNLPYYIVR